MKHSEIVWVLLGIGAIFLVIHFASAGGGASAPGVVTAQDVANATELNINAVQNENAFVANNIGVAASYLAAHDANQYALDAVVANNATQIKGAKIQAQSASDLATIQTNGAISMANIAAGAQEVLGGQAVAISSGNNNAAVQEAQITANANTQQTQLQANAASSIAGKQETSGIFGSLFGNAGGIINALKAIPVIGGLF